MKLIPHVVYNELVLPEILTLHHEGDRLTLLLSALQSGGRKLVIDLDELTPPDTPVSRTAIERNAQALLHALENSRDPVEMIALVAPREYTAMLQPYLNTLTTNGYEARLFEKPAQAHFWLGV